MYLAHGSYCDGNKILKILEDGYLRASNKTKKGKYCGDDLSKYIFLMMVKKEFLFSGVIFYLDYELLLDRVFYMNVGWMGNVIMKDLEYKAWYGKYIPTEKHNGNKMTKKKLDKALTKFLKKTVGCLKNIKNKKLVDYYKYRDHEILISKNISLKNYLVKIDLRSLSKKSQKKLEKYIENYYPDVEVII